MSGSRSTRDSLFDEELSALLDTSAADYVRDIVAQDKLAEHWWDDSGEYTDEGWFEGDRHMAD